MELEELIAMHAKIADEEKRIAALIEAKTAEKEYEAECLNNNSGVNHRRIRTLARALLDLYQKLGETPRELNDLTKCAERGMSERGLR